MGLKWFRARLSMNKKTPKTFASPGIYRSLSRFDSDTIEPRRNESGNSASVSSANLNNPTTNNNNVASQGGRSSTVYNYQEILESSNDIVKLDNDEAMKYVSNKNPTTVPQLSNTHNPVKKKKARAPTPRVEPKDKDNHTKTDINKEEISRDTNELKI